jgi:hypothetical protein
MLIPIWLAFIRLMCSAVEKPMDVIVLLAPTKTFTISCDQMRESKMISDTPSSTPFFKKFRQDQNDSHLITRRICMLLLIVARSRSEARYIFKGITNNFE